MAHPPGSHPRDITVITTHVNADFDALASMLAAQKLYPEALIVFPGAQEKNLRNFFISSMVYLFNMTDIGAVDASRVKRLVLVDTRQAGRIGRLACLLDTPGVEVHIYDHHPPAENDIKGTLEVCERTGANVTLLVEAIRERADIAISPDEATVLSLGLYEDTGSFTFASTTERDFLAAAYLLARGANLNIVSDLIARELSPEQVTLLNDMIQGARRVNVNGIEVVLTAISRETYLPDIAFLVQKMARMENIDVIFGLALMESKITVVGRSRLAEVDVGAVLTAMGGGGHAYAAAATVKGQTLTQTEEQLLQALFHTVRARRLARHLMSAPAIGVGPEVACEEANSLLTRYNVNALLVTEKQGQRDELRGFITRQVIEKALFHKLGAVPVREYMTTEAATVGPDADLAEIQKKIIENKQRILPVVDGERIIGVITRTDLLNILVGQRQESAASAEPPRESDLPRTRSVTKFMQERLPARVLEVLKGVGRTASELGCGAYVVGGFVRDLFLYRSDEDIDIVIEGDGIRFAREYARITGARIHTHEKFGTAVIIYPDGFKIDVASARMEYYKFPAALPVVEMSSIKLDLYRRDFTINTLAIQLNPDRFGVLIDFFNAQRDLKEKSIRVLHNLSFVEDPTRVFRAIRFEQRFDFSIGRLTAGLIANAVAMDFFRELSGRRVFSELRLILQEDNAPAAVARLNDLGLLKVAHPALNLGKSVMTRLNAARLVLSWYDLLFLGESYMRWAVYFLVLIQHCDTGTAAAICNRFELSPRLRKLFVNDRPKAERCLLGLERRLPPDNSGLYRRLSEFRTEIILFMMAATEREEVKKAISLYCTHLRRTSISLKGSDLKALGLAPGPAFRRILEAVFEARLNGRVRSREDELALASRLVREMPIEPPARRGPKDIGAAKTP
ncbi:MAG: CBS domain-containing protein [Desulfobacterales bacterium]